MGQTQSAPVVNYSQLETQVSSDPSFQKTIATYPSLVSSISDNLGSNATLTSSVSNAVATIIGGNASTQNAVAIQLLANPTFKSNISASVTAGLTDPTFQANLITTLTGNPAFKGAQGAQGATDFSALSPTQINTLVTDMASNPVYTGIIVTGLSSNTAFQTAVSSAITSNPATANLFKGETGLTGPAGAQGLAGTAGTTGLVGPAGSMANISNGINVGGTTAINAQGAWLQWNREGGNMNGRTYLINQKGDGVGGIVFGTSDKSDNLTHILDIDPNGNLGMQKKGSILNFAGVGDNGHGLAHANAFLPTELPQDGPFLWGWNGGQLGTNSGKPKVALRWDNSGDTGNVSVNGDLYVSGAIKLGKWSLSQDGNKNLVMKNDNGSSVYVQEDNGTLVSTGNINANGDLNGRNITASGTVQGNLLHSTGSISSDGRFRLGILDAGGKCFNFGSGGDCGAGYTMVQAKGA